MPDTGQRQELKQAIHQRMIALEEAELAEAVSHYQAYLSDSRLDDREGHDNDDLADARENVDLAQAFGHPVHNHRAKIEAIEGMDFAPTDRVGPGAVVIFANRRFVVAVSTNRFSCRGEAYMGISLQSPIYRAMRGLKAGDSFTLNGREMKIQEVF